jgi:hypothetical protein
MTMSPRLRRISLVVHITTSVGSLGAVASFLVLAFVGLSSQDNEVGRTAYPAMAMITWWVILPLILASLLTGLVSSVGTTWGLFQHYWVLVKFLLTILATVVLLLQLEPISSMARAATEGPLSNADLRALRISLVSHAAGGLLVLAVATTLAVYKPRGLTRYGWRKQHA